MSSLEGLSHPAPQSGPATSPPVPTIVGKEAFGGERVGGEGGLTGRQLLKTGWGGESEGTGLNDNVETYGAVH